jgi:hypothetical protein
MRSRRHGRAIAAGLTEVDHRHAKLVDRAELNKPISRGDAIESERHVDGLLIDGRLQRIEAGADKVSGANEMLHLTLVAPRRGQVRKRCGDLPPLLARNSDGRKIDDLAPLTNLRENQQSRRLPDKPA